MARRRFNKKFAAILSAAVVAAPAAVFVAYKLKPKDPAVFLAAADQYQTVGDVPDEISALNLVATLRPADPDVHLRLAKAYYSLREQDANTNIPKAITEWTRAEELNPTLIEAWQGLLKANRERAISTAQHPALVEDLTYLLPKQFAVAQDAAQHLLKLDPTDANARSAIPILTINLWLLNLSLPQLPEDKAKPVEQQMTDGQRIDQAVSELTAQMRDHPADAELPFWIARAKIGQAINLYKATAGESPDGRRPAAGDPAAAGGGDAATNDSAGKAAGSDAHRDGTDRDTSLAGGRDRQGDFRALLGEAAVAFDESIARRPTDALLYFRKSEILAYLLRVDTSADAVPRYQRAQRDALEHAQALVSPADPAAYTTYKVAWASFLSRSDPARAEAVYKDLLAHPAIGPTTNPAKSRQADLQRLVADIDVRVEYAHTLARDPTRRADALAILKPIPTVVPGDIPGPFQQPAAFRLAMVRLLRAQILTDALDASPNERVKAELGHQAQAEIDGASANPALAREYEVLKAKGRLQLAMGQFRDAIQTLSTAADRLAASSGGATDYQLLGWQATAYAQGEQTGAAIKLLEQAVKNPAGSNNFQTHLLLADLYLKEQDYDRGRQQVGWLSERYPDDVRVIQLQLRALGRDPDPVAIAPLYDRLPERSTAELLEKAGWAVRTRNDPETERLYRLVLKNVPGDESVSIRLAQVLVAEGKLGEANDVLDASAAANPDRDGPIKLAKSELNGADTKSVDEQAELLVKAIKDPLTRYVALYHLAQARRDLPAEVDNLERATALAPDNKDLLNAKFVAYLATKQFDKATAMLPRLSQLNADQADGHMFTFRLALAQGDTNLGLSLGHQLVQLYPQFAGSWECLGEAEEAAGQLEAACQQFTTALDHQGNNPQAMQNLVDCTIRLGRLDDARRYLAEARQKFPDDPIYREQQVRVEVTFGDPETVLPIVDEAVKTHPDTAPVYTMAVQAYAAAAQKRTGKGDADRAAEYTDKVRQLLATALKRFPDNVVFAVELSQVQAQGGTDAGVAAAAATLRSLSATEHWRRDPATVDTLVGRMYLQAARPADAEPPLRQAVELDPQAADARVALADALIARGQPQDALAVLTPAKAQPTVRAKYVDLLLALGRGADAEAELAADVKANPKDPVAANLLAHAYAAQGKWDAAADAANAALSADPGDTGAYFVRGTVEADRPRPDLDAASRDLSVFRQAFPNNVPGRVALARVLEGKHDLDGATKELEAAVAIAPDDKGARLRLIHVYLVTTPPRILDAERVVTQSLVTPQLAHDPDVQRVAAAVWLRAGDNDRAVTSIRDAMAHAHDQRAVLDEYFDILLATGHADLLLDESAKFIANPQAPAAWGVYDYRGRAHAAVNDKGAAYADFATALDLAGSARSAGPALAVAAHIADALDPAQAVRMVAPRAANSAPWKLVLAQCYQRADAHDLALTTAEAATTVEAGLVPEDRRLLDRTLAVLDMSATPPRGDKALQLLTAILKDNPDDVDALNNAACTLDELVAPPEPQAALAYASHAYDLVRQNSQINPFIYDTYGWTLILSGKADDGIEVLHQVVDQADFPDAHYHLAEAYMRKGGMWEDAKRELNAATSVANQAKHPVDPAMIQKIRAAQAEVDAQISKELKS